MACVTTSTERPLCAAAMAAASIGSPTDHVHAQLAVGARVGIHRQDGHVAAQREKRRAALELVQLARDGAPPLREDAEHLALLQHGHRLLERGHVRVLAVDRKGVQPAHEHKARRGVLKQLLLGHEMHHARADQRDEDRVGQGPVVAHHDRAAAPPQVPQSPHARAHQQQEKRREQHLCQQIQHQPPSPGARSRSARTQRRTSSVTSSTVMPVVSMRCASSARLSGMKARWLSL